MAQKGRVVDKQGKWLAFKSLLGQLGDQRLTVGIVEGEIATYAAANEFGTDTIPSRPFMRTTIDTNAKKYAGLLGRGARAGITGGIQATMAHLTALGLVVRSDMIRTIVGWTTPPNAPSTMAQKRGVDNPLVDTGDMQRAITFEVRSSLGLSKGGG